MDLVLESRLDPKLEDQCLELGVFFLSSIKHADEP